MSWTPPWWPDGAEPEPLVMGTRRAGAGHVAFCSQHGCVSAVVWASPLWASFDAMGHVSAFHRASASS